MIALRGHHLLCLLTYVGEGYTRAFVANYDALAARLALEDVRIVAGPDDICAPLLAGGEAHCRLERVAARDDSALLAVSDCLGREVRVGSVLRLDVGSVARLRTAFRNGIIRAACRDCAWDSLCTSIAATGFRRVRFNPAPGSGR
ncbi:DUF1284 domain-containing protein [Methylobacterium indicum]|nr:DUF1284 domain-containing protein [Methylobacterium indicum]